MKRLYCILVLCIFFLHPTKASSEENEATDTSDDAEDDLEDDPIVEDMSKVDFSNLEVVSK